MEKPQPFPCYSPDLVRAHLPDFGLLSVTIDTAAELVALELWELGEYPDIKAPEEFDDNFFDPRLLSALKQQIAEQKQRLLGAIDVHRLPIEIESRNFDERLETNNCYLSLQALMDWMMARGVESGVTLRYVESLNTAREYLCDQVNNLQTLARSSTEVLGEWYPPRTSESDDEGEVSAEAATSSIDRAAYYKLLVENQRLRDQLATKGEEPKERPIKTSERKALRRLVIAMAKKGFGWDPQKRNGAVGEITKALQDVGIEMSDDSVRSYLNAAKDELPKKNSWVPGTDRR